MIVSFDIYKVVNVIHLITWLLLIFTALRKNKDLKNYIFKLILTSMLVFIHIAKIPIKMHIDKSYVINLLGIIIWFMYAILVAFIIGTELETSFKATHKLTEELTDKTTNETTDE